MAYRIWSALLATLLWVTLMAPVGADPGGVPNFGKVSDTLYRGGQPTHDGFVALRNLGIKTVVDLRWEQNDQRLLQGLGFHYAHIRSFPGVWRAKDVLRFLSIASDPANQPVFVHCQHGADRTGEMVAAYRVVEQGWAPEAASEEALTYHFTRLYGHVMDMLKSLDIQAVRSEVSARPSGDLRTP